MTNSTPNFIAWIAEYRKYQDLVKKGALEDAESLKSEIEEGLQWVDMTWSDLEFAVSLGSEEA
jgi:hypothetical protein